jgi:hypothetical protein
MDLDVSHQNSSSFVGYVEMDLVDSFLLLEFACFELVRKEIVAYFI